MEEIWKDIVGYEGLYQVSNLGRVKSLGNGNSNASKEKILKPGANGKGYSFINLCKDGKAKNYHIHRLVLMAFNPVENMENLEVDHIDTNPSNNILENLRWTTHKENCNNSLSKIKYIKSKKGENNPNYGKFGVKHQCSIPIVQLTLEGNMVEVYGSSMDAGRVGFTVSNINKCANGKSKIYRGYKWEYLYKYLLLKYPKISELNLFGKSYNRKEVNNNA